jgi:DNA-binding transcriptional LysR family regulator
VATLKQLGYARALARLRSFRVAARELHLSQPALTRSIRALEDALGVPLFDRRPDGVAPTAFGELFLGKAEAILLAHDDLVRDMQLMANLEKGTLCVSAGAYPSAVLVPRVAAALATKHPTLACRLRHGGWREVTAQVLGREADLGVAEISEAVRDPRLQTEPLGRHQLFFYCRAGHPLLGRSDLSLSQIAGFPWVSTRLPSRMGGVLSTLPVVHAGAIDPATDTFCPAWEVEVIDTAKLVVAESDAIGGAMLSQIERELEQGTLCVLSYHAPWLRFEYGFLYLSGRTVSPAALAFMAECRRQDALLAGREAVLQEGYGLQPADRGA